MRTLFCLTCACVLGLSVSGTWAVLDLLTAKDQNRIEKAVEGSCRLPLTTLPAPVPWLFNWYAEGQLT